MATANSSTFSVETPRTTSRARPELLAPAGDRTCLIAAIENGADAVYFGVKGHNARARASNFDLDELHEVMALLHQRGVRGYVTLNTLIFPAELSGVEAILRSLVVAGVDAVIVQDIGLARLIRALTPDLEIHGSTQMSITSASGVRLAQELGCSRVILARELSLREIARIQGEADLPVEVFVHGALCVAYSGQCLTSEALGGRSANRGECAQACRMPYEVVRDGKTVDLKEIQYLLSPQDLAAFDLVPQLVDLGVASLKIEGRLKAPEYVASITRNYRKAIDAACLGNPLEFPKQDVQEMEMTFSRGFSHGFLDGNNHKVLVRGDYAKKRGLFLGTVTAVVGSRVRLDLHAPVKPGDGVVFVGQQEDNLPEQGGRVYEVTRPGRSRRDSTSCGPEGLSEGTVELSFGRRDIDLGRIQPGQRLWKTDDPELTRRVRKTFEGSPKRLVDLDVSIHAETGRPLALNGKTATGLEARVVSTEELEKADRQVATLEDLRAQVDRLGGTLYQLRSFEAEIEGGPMVPRSLLNQLRRELVERLDTLAANAPSRTLAEKPVLPELRAALLQEKQRTVKRQRGTPTVEISCRADLGLPSDLAEAGQGLPYGDPDFRGTEPTSDPDAPMLSTLCRHREQVEAAILSGLKTIYLDYQDIKLYQATIGKVRQLSTEAKVFIATPRIEKPGETNLFRYLSNQGADGLLVRNAGGLYHCVEQDIPFIADFSLNAANELTVELLKAKGASRVTASYDLSAEQLFDLLDALPPSWLEVVIHQRIPMFLMEHCVFCAVLSPGTDKTNCGRPCDRHDVKLRDRVGMEHPLKADVGCRNTLFHALPQTAAEYLPRLLDRGARHFRVEFLDDSPEIVSKTLGLYKEALANRRDSKTLWRALKASNQYGVTRGQLAVL